MCLRGWRATVTSGVSSYPAPASNSQRDAPPTKSVARARRAGQRCACWSACASASLPAGALGAPTVRCAPARALRLLVGQCLCFAAGGCAGRPHRPLRSGPGLRLVHMTAIKVRVVRAPVYATNTAIVSGPDAAVVVDPGAGTTDDVAALLEQEGLALVAVLITHGHVDHTWDAAALSERFDAPVLVSPDDAYRLTDPFGIAGGPATHDPAGPLADALRDAGHDPAAFVTPAAVLTLGSTEADAVLSSIEDRVGGRWSWIAAPGHTEGATVYVVSYDDGDVHKEIAFTGDVLFSSGVGRTDLHGGDAQLMERTLARLGTELTPETLIVPGHGPGSTIAAELAKNPLLRARR